MSEPIKKQCSNCGSWMDSSAVFCPQCGSQNFLMPEQQAQQPQQFHGQGQSQQPQPPQFHGQGQPQQPQPPQFHGQGQPQQPQPYPQTQSQARNQGQPPQPANAPKKKKGLIIGIVIALVAILLFVFVLFPALTGKRKPRPASSGNVSAGTVAEIEAVEADGVSAAVISYLS